MSVQLFIGKTEIGWSVNFIWAGHSDWFCEHISPKSPTTISLLETIFALGL